MYGILMFFFIILCFFMALFILIQPGKGDMGLGSLGGGGQILFVGSGGQTFFEKATWIMGAIFMLGAIGLCVLKSHETKESRLQGFTATKNSNLAQQPVKNLELPTKEESAQAEIPTQPVKSANNL